MPREIKGFLFFFYGIALLVYAATVFRYVPAHLVFDEAEFALEANAILRTGTPQIPVSNENPRIYHDGTYFGYPAYLGMWHPPVYLYSLALGQKLFGGGNAAYRLTSLAWFLPSLALAAWIGARLSVRREKLLRFLTIPLALLIPLIAEGSLFVDIDNSSLTFFVLLLAALYLHNPEDDSFGKMILLGGAFFAALCSKLTTPYLFLAAMVIYQTLKGKFFLGIRQAFVIGSLGTSLFAAAYVSYCAFFHYPWRYMFEFSYLGKTGSAVSPHSLIQCLHSLRWHIVWLSPAVAFVFGLLAVKKRPITEKDFLWIFFAIGLCVYVLMAARWGKYMFPLVLAVLPAVASELSESLEAVHVRRLGWFLAVLLIWGIVHFLWLPPLQIRTPGFAMGHGIMSAIKDVRNLYLAAAVFSFFLFYFAVKPAFQGAGRVVLMTVFLAYFLLANSISAVKLLASPYECGPYAPHLQVGFEETVRYINRELISDVIYCPKEMSFYFKGRHYAIDDNASLGPVPAEDLKRFPEIRYVIDSKKYPALTWTEEDRERNQLQLVKEIGDYSIYRTNTSGGEK